jgi:diaminopimelate decarboxylase
MLDNLYKKIKRIDTPFYMYDANLIEKNVKTLVQSFSNCASLFFAVKANTSVAVLKIIKQQKIGAEVVSPGEIFICLKAGFRPDRILYNNIARKEDEILYSIKKGVVFFNFEALDQASLLEKCARRLKKKIKIFARINPGIFPRTHPHLSTGSSWSKFGIEMVNLKEAFYLTKKFKYAQLVGIHCHIGSQILSSTPFIRAVKRVSEAIEIFNSNGQRIEYVNLGGGFGIPYHPRERELNFMPIKKAYQKIAKHYGVKIFLEPGRFIVGNAGYLVTRVISIKKRNGMALYIVDAGMTENPRPAIYGAYHHIEPMLKKKINQQRVRVTGPLCENSDEFGVYTLRRCKIGDLLVIHNCGAYTRTMASNYNGRVLPAEFVYHKKSLVKIRKKQKFESLINNERY